MGTLLMLVPMAILTVDTLPGAVIRLVASTEPTMDIPFSAAIMGTAADTMVIAEGITAIVEAIIPIAAMAVIAAGSVLTAAVTHTTAMFEAPPVIRAVRVMALAGTPLAAFPVRAVPSQVVRHEALVVVFMAGAAVAGNLLLASTCIPGPAIQKLSRSSVIPA